MNAAKHHSAGAYIQSLNVGHGTMGNNTPLGVLAILLCMPIYLYCLLFSLPESSGLLIAFIGNEKRSKKRFALCNGHAVIPNR
jgi:hypothetical protein